MNSSFNLHNNNVLKCHSPCSVSLTESHLSLQKENKENKPKLSPEEAKKQAEEVLRKAREKREVRSHNCWTHGNVSNCLRAA